METYTLAIRLSSSQQNFLKKITKHLKNNRVFHIGFFKVIIIVFEYYYLKYNKNVFFIFLKFIRMVGLRFYIKI